MTEAEAYVAFNLTDNIGSVGVGRLSAAQGGSVADAWLTYGNHVSFDGQPVDYARITQEFAKARASGKRASAGTGRISPFRRGFPLRPSRSRSAGWGWAGSRLCPESPGRWAAAPS